MSSSAPVPDRGSWIEIPAIVFCVVSPTIVSIRFWSRFQLSARLGVDDWVILAALIFSLACNGVLLAAVSYGYGKHGVKYGNHAPDITPDHKIHALMYFVFSQYFYKCTINLTKASILLLYLRLFVQRPFRIICWILLGFVATFGLATLLGSILQCRPIQKSWNKSIKGGTCINTTEFWYANAGFSILGDVIILLLPMPVIWGLKLQVNQKLGLMLVFALGAFVIVTSVERMTTLNTTSKSPDPTWDVGATMWTIIEPNIAILCACLPMCRMPLQRLFPKIFSSVGETKRPTTNSLSYAGSSWTPSQVGRRNPRGQFSSVVTGKDNKSEEYILADRNNKSFLDTSGGEGRIHKTTHISVKYDDGRSEKSGDRTPRGNMESEFDSIV